MGYVTIAVLALTVIALLFGAFFGMLRGRNRAILRLILVIICVLCAIFLRDMVVDTVMGIKVGGKTLKATIAGAFSTGGTEFPESIQNLVFALVEIIIGMVAYFVILIALRLVSWIILFPFLKIFVKREENKKRGVGALVGLLQGIIIAFFTLAPLTGLVGQVDKLSSVKLGGKNLIPIPANIGVHEYMDSAPGKIYSKSGGWLFDLITSGKDASGNKISIDDTLDVVVTVANVADTLDGITASMDAMSSETATPQERLSAIKDIGSKFENLGSSIDDLSPDAKNMINSLIADLGESFMGEPTEGGEPAENPLAGLNLDVIDLGSAGSAMNGIATYIEKTEEEFGNTDPVNEADADKIVGGLAGNLVLFGGMEGSDGASTILPVRDEDKALFEASIAKQEISDEDKETLRGLLGLK